MKQILLAMLLVSGVAASAQTAVAPSAASGTTEETTAHIFGHGYDASKKYTVFKIWNAKDPLTEKESAELDRISKQLSKKNVEVVKFEWKTNEDLQELFTKYGIETTVSVDKGVELRSEKHHYNTDASKVLFVFEEKKPVSLCSGASCESHLKSFFKIVALN